MSSSDQITAVIIASAQSVGKVYLIGGVGWMATKLPNTTNPFLPLNQVAMVARFSFHILTLALIYSTVAQSINPENFDNYWFLIAGGGIVLAISYITATILGYILNIHTISKEDFIALRIAATFPNIVALPILIFPSLCQFPVVYEGYNFDGDDPKEACIATSNTMIFCYFFTWSLLFWTFGYPQLMAAAESKQQQHEETTLSSSTTTTRAIEEGNINGNNNDNIEEEESRNISSNNNSLLLRTRIKQKIKTFTNAVYKTMTSPGFIAMLAGIITGCIPPIKDIIFTGALRFLGDGISTLGVASSPLSTIVVAASLVPQSSSSSSSEQENNNNSNSQQRTRSLNEDESIGNNNSSNSSTVSQPIQRITEEEEEKEKEVDCSPAYGIDDGGNSSSGRNKNENTNNNNRNENTNDNDNNNFMSDPNFGPNYLLRTTSRRVRQSVVLIWNAKNKLIKRRLLLWFIFSRLIIAPTLVTSTIIGMECNDWLIGVPKLALLVVILNSCLPGALIVVVLLKSQKETTESAAAVAQVYLPTYILSILTIAAWTALGLYITLPDENGNNSIC